MAKATRICRVCGKEYEYCHTIRKIDDIFRYQDVACSPECGAIYFAKIDESRGVKPIDDAKKIVGKNKAKAISKPAKEVAKDEKDKTPDIKKDLK